MQNPHTKWRIDFARHLTKRLVTFEGIKAIIIAGSVACDFADEYSDVEIPIFWKTLPDDATRLAIVAALHADFLYAYDGPAREDQLLINGFQVDMWHIAVDDEEAIIKAVLEGHNLDLGGLNAMDTIRSCIPLYGQETIKKWKEQVQAYPEGLVRKIIQDHISSFRVADLFILAARDNPTAFYRQLSYLHQEIFLVLLALNRRYFPTFKWLFRTLESMQVKPKNIDQRFRQAFKLPCSEAIADTRQLLEETLALVELQFPHLDTTLAHRQLGYTRTAQLKPITS
jgi:hypothetical protein